MALTNEQREILQVIADLGTDTYGVPVSKELEKRRGHIVSLGNMYFALARMEEQGLVTSWETPGGPERSGRNKRYWGLTDQGADVLMVEREPVYTFDHKWRTARMPHKCWICKEGIAMGERYFEDLSESPAWQSGARAHKRCALQQYKGEEQTT